MQCCLPFNTDDGSQQCLASWLGAQLSHIYELMAGSVPVMCNQYTFGVAQDSNEPLYISKKAVHLVCSASLHSIAAYVLWTGFMQ